MDHPPNARLKGHATSPGLTRAPAFVHRNFLDVLPELRPIERSEVSGELASMDRALNAVLADLKMSALRIEAQTGPKLAAIFGAHEVMLQDAGLKREIFNQIEQNLIGAAQALARVFQGWQAKFRARPEDWLRERADDLEDLEGRLLREIAGVKTTVLEKMPPGRVLVAHRLFPSETVALSQLQVAGIVLEFGGPGSHAAVIARALGIPTVAQIPDAIRRIDDGDDVIVDGFEGEVILRPDDEEVAKFGLKVSIARQDEEAIRRTALQPALTKGGIEISVMANVGSRQDVVAAVEKGAEGVGLFRTEQFYLGRTTPPSEDEFLNELRAMFAPLAGKPATIRLLDLGADKPVPFLNFPVEDDPFLGCRGVRLLLRYPELLDTQLAAILEFSLESPLRILVPMVTTEGDMAQVRQRAVEMAAASGVRVLPPLGAMIETPAAALSVPAIGKHADFLSIGTNDLTQYTMAAGRENPLVNEYFVDRHPAVLRLIQIVLSESGAMPVSLCGELAAEPAMTETLVALGVRHFSVAPPLVPLIKSEIRKIGGERDDETSRR
jgi:phosphoenolpyruvate-protein phosphotransferase